MCWIFILNSILHGDGDGTMGWNCDCLMSVIILNNVPSGMLCTLL